MARSKKHIITKKQQFDMKKPRFNPYQTGHGAHKNKRRYDRRKFKNAFDGY